MENNKFTQIFDLLLMAGYFRVRITGLSPLDKIIGGLAWCITHSYVDVDIEYNDEMQLGQKIKVAEKIVQVLQNLGCPQSLSPHQIQGMDLEKIHGVLQWLIKLVIQQRDFRQDQHHNIASLNSAQILSYEESKYLGKANEISELQSSISHINHQRLTKNANVKNLPLNDPLRVYSALIEYGDVSAYKTYNTLVGIITGKSKLNGKTMVQALFEDLKQQEIKQDSRMNVNFEAFQKQQKEQEIKILKELQTDISNVQEQLENNKEFNTLKRRNTIEGQSLIKLLIGQQDIIKQSLDSQEQQEDEETRERNQKLKALEEKKNYIQQRMEIGQTKINLLGAEVEQLRQKKQTVQQEIDKLSSQKEEILLALRAIEEKMSNVDKLKKNEMQNLVSQLQKAKEHKQAVKQSLRQRLIDQQDEEEEFVQQYNSWQQIHKQQQQYYNNIYQKIAEPYHQMQEKLQNLNQEILVLQNKVDYFPSASEIQQYLNRILEMVNSINQCTEQYKLQYISSTQYDQILAFSKMFKDIILTFKDNYINNIKNKKSKQELVVNLTNTFGELEQNFKRIKEQLQVQTDTSVKLKNEEKSMIEMEQKYVSLMKKLKSAYEKLDEQ